MNQSGRFGHQCLAEGRFPQIESALTKMANSVDKPVLTDRPFAIAPVTSLLQAKMRSATHKVLLNRHRQPVRGGR